VDHQDVRRDEEIRHRRKIPERITHNDTKFNNFGVLNNNPAAPTGASQQWYDWIYKRVTENVSYDKIIEGVVTGVSRVPGESYAEFCDYMTKAVKGDANYADRPDMPYYWARRDFNKPEERAIGFAYAFLGIRIQCAQCHKHPFDQWSKSDFDDFRNFFPFDRRPNNVGTIFPATAARA